MDPKDIIVSVGYGWGRVGVLRDVSVFLETLTGPLTKTRSCQKKNRGDRDRRTESK